MLSSADQAVCARDPALPGLPIILDAATLARKLGLDTLTPAYLRYKPGVSCTASFMHPKTGAMAVFAYARDRYKIVRERQEWARQPSITFLDEICIVVVPARLDRELTALRRYFNPERRPKYLRRVLGRREGFCKGDLTLLRYKPGRRFVARIDWKGRPRAALKVTNRHDFNRALIGATGAAAHGGSPLLGASSHLQALLTGWVRGRHICPEALGCAPDLADIEEVGAALARLHAASFRPAASISLTDDRVAMAAMAEDLDTLDKALSRNAARIGARIGARLANLECAQTLVHGDFSADQVVLTKKKPVILDWDQAAFGDPGRDLGVFRARLDAQAQDGQLTQTEADALGATLGEGYAQVASAVPASATLHHARALVLLASEGFRMRRPDWLERSHNLLARAESLLTRSSRPCRDPAMPTLDPALSKDRMWPEIVRLLGRRPPADVRIAAPELIRHKPGRRALVRYRIDGMDSPLLLGKIRAKGPDLRTPRVHHALRASGLDGRMTHGVGVPRVFGQIDKWNMWLQEEVPGRSLGHFLGATTGAHTDVFARTGAALARLHDTTAVSDRRWTLQNELQVLDQALEGAASEMPGSADALREIGLGARAELEALEEVQPCGIHRDFYFDQVLADGGRIWIVDLDLYTLGDPAIDLGNFLAHLDELGLRLFGERSTYAAEAAAFLAGYRARRPLQDVHRVKVLRAISLARHIHISTRFSDRRHITRDLIAMSLETLAAKKRKAS